MQIYRTIEKFLKERQNSGKVLIVYGPRQAGKTTAVKNYLKSLGPRQDILLLNGEENHSRSLLTNASLDNLAVLVVGNKILFIDEAQWIENIGLTLKRLHDNFEELQIIASGSSSFDLANKAQEPLTGRHFEYVLLPPSFAELASSSNQIEEMRHLESRLIFGSYPEVVTHPDDAKERLSAIGSSYLYKDVLQLDGFKAATLLDKLLRALSFQIGQEVSYSEVAQTIGCNPRTVERYVEILEKSFIIFRLPSFARNLRNELKKSRKIYFYDCGIRNYVLNNFNLLASRSPNEIGQLFENYFVSERLKWRLATKSYARQYFWRTTSGNELDLLEEEDGQIRAFEIKWNPEKAKKGPPASFLKAYPEAQCQMVSKENYFNFLI